MAGTQTTPQVPPVQANTTQAAPVPDHRFEEMARKLQQMENQNAQLRGQVDMLSRAPTPGNPAQVSEFDPKVEAALQKLIAAKLTPLQTNITNQLGYLYDKSDQIEYAGKYGGDRFKKYDEKVNQIRHEQQLAGKWTPREEALRMAFFDETGKKPLPDKPLEAAEQPAVWDHYLNTYVDPLSRKPAKPPGLEFQTQQQPQPQGTVPVIAPPQQQMPQAPPQNLQPPAIPAEVPFNMTEQLPPQGINQPALAPQTTPQHLEVGLESSPEELAAWGEKYGDVPL